MALAAQLHPQVLDVVRTRAEPLGIVVDGGTIDDQTCALLVPWPDTHGVYGEFGALIEKANAGGVVIVFVADPLALTLTEPVSALGADIAVGSMQRFGVPMGFGGPHAADRAVSAKLTRLMPGRLVGQSVDAHGRPGYRLALQTREQHIRRDKATSNICTAQALLANMAAAYAIWHGPEGLQEIATRVHGLASRFAAALKSAGKTITGSSRFDTVTVDVKGKAAEFAAAAESKGYLLRVVDADQVGVSFDETSNGNDLEEIAKLFGATAPADADSSLPGKLRGKAFLTQPVFHENRSETEMMRLLRRLADKDLALDRTMIPLGSCTMKLNAAAEMMPVIGPPSPTSIRLRRSHIRPATGRCSPTWTRGSARSPASTPSRFSPTPAVRANMRACSPSAAIICRVATLAAALPDPLLRPRYEPRQRGNGRHGRRCRSLPR